MHCEIMHNIFFCAICFLFVNHPFKLIIAGCHFIASRVVSLYTLSKKVDPNQFRVSNLITYFSMLSIFCKLIFHIIENQCSLMHNLTSNVIRCISQA